MPIRCSDKASAACVGHTSVRLSSVAVRQVTLTLHLYLPDSWLTCAKDNGQCGKKLTAILDTSTLAMLLQILGL
jgi:hypothetical protein